MRVGTAPNPTTPIRNFNFKSPTRYGNFRGENAEEVNHQQALLRFQRTRDSYFFSSVGAGAGGFAVVVEAGGFVGGGSRIPSLNSRMPCPRPCIISGILRPPKNTRTTIAIIARCQTLNSMDVYLSRPGLTRPGTRHFRTSNS